MSIHQPILSFLSRHLPWNKARLKCFNDLIIGVIRHRTVNLSLLATCQQSSKAKPLNKYRKLQRFFEKFDLPQQDVGRLILSKLTKPRDGWVLSMDRTNWKLGQSHINVLTVGVVVNKVAIPVVWKVLPQCNKQGNSNTPQRIEVMKELLQLMEASSIKVILMDREFVGKKWLSWLDRQGVGFIARIKNNTIVGNRLAGEYTSIRGRKPVRLLEVWGQELFFGAKKITKGRTSHLYVVSNRFTGKEALKLYRKRWSIELLFSHLKKRGFNLEDTHMTDSGKIEKLMSIISLSFLFTFGWGCYLRNSQKETSASKRKSLFRIGLEDLLHMLTNLSSNRVNWRSFIRWLKSFQLAEFFDV